MKPHQRKVTYCVMLSDNRYLIGLNFQDRRITWSSTELQWPLTPAHCQIAASPATTAQQNASGETARRRVPLRSDESDQKTVLVDSTVPKTRRMRYDLR